MNWIKHPLELPHLGVLSGASKIISEPTVCLAQTCTYLEPTPALSPNRPKRDSAWPTSPWSSIVRVQNDFRGGATFGANYAPIKWIESASTWDSSPRSTIGCVQNDFWAYSMFSANHAPILHRSQHYLQIDQNEIPHDPRHLKVPSSASKMISGAVVRSPQTMHLSCVKISTIFERSKLRFHLILVI
jgi:hypothetical protein